MDLNGILSVGDKCLASLPDPVDHLIDLRIAYMVVGVVCPLDASNVFVAISTSRWIAVI